MSNLRKPVPLALALSVLSALSLALSPAASAQIGAAINKQAAPAIAGTWQNTETGAPLTLLLLPDGTGEFNGTMLKYSLAGAKLTLAMAGNQPVTYGYSLSGDKLTLSGGDLKQALAFMRTGSTQGGMAGGQTGGSTAIAPAQGATKPAAGGAPSPAGIVGIWEGYGETMEFRPGGVAIYLGQQMQYSVAGSTLTLVAGGQSVPMAFAISGNQLTLAANGKTLVYTRRGSVGAAGNQAEGGGGPGNQASGGGAAGPRGGIIAPEIVGTWAWIDVTNTNSGGISSSTYITIKPDGTYEYHSEGSISVNGGAGGTASQSGDRGTWRLEGSILHVQSQTYGVIDYRFEKRNHPKTGDPMIVIDGQPYVTYYQKAPWR
jgi:hypothetical protein